MSLLEIFLAMARLGAFLALGSDDVLQLVGFLMTGFAAFWLAFWLATFWSALQALDRVAILDRVKYMDAFSLPTVWIQFFF